MSVVIDGSSLSLAALVGIARDGDTAELSPAAREHMAATRAVVEEALARGDAVYGLTTGLAERKRVVTAPEERRRFNRALVRSHRIASGTPAAEPVVRAVMAVLANSLAKGYAGVRPGLVDMVLGELAAGRTPVVRTLGSVGQADLGPMADLAEGMLSSSGYEPAEGEGLALLNNNALSTGWGALALDGAVRLLDTLDAAAALDLEAFGANPSPLHPAVAESRPSDGLASTLRRLRSLLEGSALFEPGAQRNLQDPLTFRCIPQIHGSTRDVFEGGVRVVERALNSSQGNPIVVLEDRAIVSVGNFDSLPVASALDFVRIALASALTAAAERTVKLLQAPFSGLSAGLAGAPESGEDALAEFAVTAQGLAVEAKLLAQPVSHELASTSKAEGLEDRTTMAPTSARKLEEMTGFAHRLVAIELAVAAQAIDLRARLRGGGQPLRLGRGTAVAYEAVRSSVRFTGAGEDPPVGFEALERAVAAGELVIGS